MNWAAVGAIGEVLGAIGVIGSLLYVAVQVRSNTRTVRASTHQAAAATSGTFSLTLGSDPEVAAVFSKGLAGVDDLSSSEAAQFHWLLHGVLRQLENAHFQMSNGTMDGELWLGWKEAIRGMVGSPGGRQWWPTVRPRLRSSFVEFIEQDVLASSTDASTANYVHEEPEAGSGGGAV